MAVAVATSGDAEDRGDAAVALTGALRPRRTVAFAAAGRPEGEAVAVPDREPDPGEGVSARLREV
ncbi:hypothetical protein ACF07V_04610 [Streptomyces sp. NPDC015661]|uniref:hypothetical protein n=1 Tax=Streptomyces sp. NPDC015661 TaxID=3364961 RepID=UPI0036F993A9